MFEKPQFSCEHRLGLVVYGGVSLAIYMNGICQEFYNAVRGRGIYKLVKALTDADIVVDIVSGTSAGGINGVLLSYALANTNEAKQENGQSSKQSEIKFEKFSEVWKNSGDIQKLLFGKEYDKVEKASFLNGTGYYKPQVKQALKDRWDDLNKSSPEDNWFSEFGELDLFITGTDLLGRIYQIFDNTGSVIDVKDHRATFHLKYRDYGDNDFKRDDATCEVLAKLCQITSCFPVAFPPVTVKLDSQNDVDEQLVKWGSLKKNRIPPSQEPESDRLRSLRHPRIREIDDDPGKGYRLHFVDGGVLNNRPFTPTIKAIYHRAAERPVFRKLFYVDPSPDCFRDSPTHQGMLKPNIAQVALSSLIGMPRYQSINNDLELIKEHNEKVRRYKFLWADIENLLDQEATDTENKDIYDQQKNVYLRTRLTSLRGCLRSLDIAWRQSKKALIPLGCQKISTF
jgi:patatin-related protein